MSESLNDLLGEIEEVDVVNLKPKEDITEQAYLEMGEQFKEINTKKNELIKDLKKAIMVIYSLIKTADDNSDPEMMAQARQSASEYIDVFFFNDED